MVVKGVNVSFKNFLNKCCKNLEIGDKGIVNFILLVLFFKIDFRLLLILEKD